jgi:hypothetical protein
MKNKELQELLKNFPDDMEVWVSDNGYCEGGERLNKVQVVKAIDAGLDGDQVGDEYIYVEDDTNISEYLVKGYFLSEDGETLSKEIIYLNNSI